ncbi:hypothetical protein [Aeromicrobium endophyticum]|uniref:Uncharacterized protein n=1 Tax=Aeromicrobium endophyticum TaxID=2292704 RepID=A0A371PDS1_9ACTN|nr:hypothetical protein [Aeromicrobium endophyticum]REK73658.1 hypothetical protein DX116_09035 [Aeromicrobium endophyticum]
MTAHPFDPKCDGCVQLAVINEAQVKAWDEGRAFGDPHQRRGRPDPADNPYRSSPAPVQAAEAPGGALSRCRVCGGSEIEHTYPTSHVMRSHEAHEVEGERFEMVSVPTFADPGAEMPGPPVFVRGDV